MKRQSTDGKEPKTRYKRAGETGSEARNLAQDDITHEDIDPAEFIDPEEFRSARPDFKPFRP
jgi:hypothetical protein